MWVLGWALMSTVCQGAGPQNSHELREPRSQDETWLVGRTLWPSEPGILREMRPKHVKWKQDQLRQGAGWETGEQE